MLLLLAAADPRAELEAGGTLTVTPTVTAPGAATLGGQAVLAVRAIQFARSDITGASTCAAAPMESGQSVLQGTASLSATPAITVHQVSPQLSGAATLYCIIIAPGDGSPVEVGDRGTHVVVLLTDPWVPAHTPGPSVVPLPIVGDNPYRPSESRVVILSGN